MTSSNISHIDLNIKTSLFLSCVHTHTHTYPYFYYTVGPTLWVEKSNPY